MSRLKSILVLGSILMLAGSVRAEGPVPSEESLGVTVEREPINAAEPVFRAFITVGDDKFTFVLPEKFRTGGDAAHGRLELQSLEGNTVITFTFFDVRADGSVAFSPERYKEMVSDRHPGGKFVQEYTRPAGGNSGPVYDVEWNGAGGLRMKTRSFYLPTSAGVLELTLTTGAKNFPAAKDSLDEVLATLQTKVNGKLVVHRLSDKL